MSDESVEYHCSKCDAPIDNPYDQKECPNGHNLSNNLEIHLSLGEVMGMSEKNFMLILDRAVKEGKITENEKNLYEDIWQQAKETLTDPVKIAAIMTIIKILTNFTSGSN